jgi:hypothetical protein
MEHFQIIDWNPEDTFFFYEIYKSYIGILDKYPEDPILEFLLL